MNNAVSPALKRTVKCLMKIHEISDALDEAIESDDHEKIDMAVTMVYQIIRLLQIHDGWHDPDPEEDDGLAPQEFLVVLEMDDEAMVEIRGPLDKEMVPDGVRLFYKDSDEGEREYLLEPEDHDALINFSSTIWWGSSKK